MGWRGYNYQRRRGKAALDAATEKERMAGDRGVGAPAGARKKAA